MKMSQAIFGHKIVPDFISWPNFDWTTGFITSLGYAEEPQNSFLLPWDWIMLKFYLFFTDFWNVTTKNSPKTPYLSTFQ